MTNYIGKMATASSCVRVLMRWIGGGEDTIFRTWTRSSSHRLDLQRLSRWGSDEDSLSGMAGNDTILGGTGNDELFGDDHGVYTERPVGNDCLDGGDGRVGSAGSEDDTLISGIGKDRLFGDNRPAAKIPIFGPNARGSTRRGFRDSNSGSSPGWSTHFSVTGVATTWRWGR